MKLLETVADFRQWRGQHENVGFVPTMGALHAGHAALIAQARRECAQVAVSIFVNPTQFNDKKDLERYPRPLEQDLQMLSALGVDAVFLPGAAEIYADKYRFEVRENELSQILCGPTRPGHFNGVLTVVLKLFHIVRPRRAYFGEKDYQQLRLIQDMAAALFLDIEVIACPTVRESDGLAMSSRNALLTESERMKAPVLYKILTTAESAEQAVRLLRDEGFRVDYVEEHFGRRFAAAFLGSVRLIDNVVT